MLENMSWESLARYFAGESPNNERQEIESWIYTDSKNQALYDSLKEIYNSSARPLPKSDAEAAFRKVMDKAAEKPRYVHQNQSQSARGDQKQVSVVYNMPVRRILAYAAVLIMLVLVPSLYSVLDREGSVAFNDADLISVIVEHGKAENLTLPDGTEITLDSGSEFKYPETFTGDTREVFLSGEAFFKVESNPQKPFIVHAENAHIEVLGTQFNVRAWELSGYVSVVVSEGKVSLQEENGSDENSVIIEKNQLSYLTRNGTIAAPVAVNSSSYTTWINREITFHNVKLLEVTEQIERWYGLSIEFEQASYLELKVSVNIRNRPVDEILNLIEVLTDLEYEQDGSIVIFKR
ncbi:FecR family protein [candidate division KSB1 bacterium]